ncbi:MAG TPA: nitrogenase component 1 [Myxococcota bacterium]|nr:nitrogenase component 1 [Myxococcota bacterium]HQK51657.1 nitrogenase component 1 [Myxococcota bacterium]
MPPPFDATLRLSPTFMDGVFLSVAAIPDAALLYVGSTCINEHFRHSLQLADWGQDLLRDGQQSRLLLTFSDKTVAPMGVGHQVDLVVRRMLPTMRPALLVLAELTRVTLAGEDLETLAESVTGETGLPTIAATSRLLVRDWQTAFRRILVGLAEGIPDAAFEGGPVPGTVAVIGHLFQRNEADQHADVREWKTLLRMAGLEPLSIWLSRETVPELHRAARASWLVALPQGREAARRIARRSGAQVIDLDLPIGLQGTEEVVLRLADASGNEGPARTRLDEALRAVLPLVDQAAGHRLAGRRVALAALPDWSDGTARMFREDFGLDVAATTRRCRLITPEEEAAGVSQDLLRDHDPSVASWNEVLRRAMDEGPLDLIVGSSWERNALQGLVTKVPFVEFGYPCLSWHDLVGLPGMGLGGVVAWAHRLCAALEDRF